MTLKVIMVVMSHLSDAQSVMSNSRHHINFAKFLLLKYSDTETWINADEEYSEFREKHPMS